MTSYPDIRTLCEPMCWKFGHVAKACPNTTLKLCPKCGGKHENCATTTLTCTNCKGDHMSMDKSCPAYEREKSLRKLMGNQNWTYKTAYNTYAGARHQNAMKLSECADVANEVTQHEERNTEPEKSEPLRNKAPNKKQSYANAVRGGNTTCNQNVDQTRNEPSPSQNTNSATPKSKATEKPKEGNREPLEAGGLIKSLLELLRTWRQGRDWKTGLKKLLASILEWVKKFFVRIYV